ncbi:MAG: hypothetical protein V4543_17205 [Bacteroidota bacterium]
MYRFLLLFKFRLSCVTFVLLLFSAFTCSVKEQGKSESTSVAQAESSVAEHVKKDSVESQSNEDPDLRSDSVSYYEPCTNVEEPVRLDTIALVAVFSHKKESAFKAEYKAQAYKYFDFELNADTIESKPFAGSVNAFIQRFNLLCAEYGLTDRLKVTNEENENGNLTLLGSKDVGLQILVDTGWGVEVTKVHLVAGDNCQLMQILCYMPPLIRTLDPSATPGQIAGVSFNLPPGMSSATGSVLHGIRYMAHSHYSVTWIDIERCKGDLCKPLPKKEY